MLTAKFEDLFMCLFGSSARRLSFDPSAIKLIFEKEFELALDAIEEEREHATMSNYDYRDLPTYLDVHEEVYRYLAETSASKWEGDAAVLAKRAPHLNPDAAELALALLSKPNAIWYQSLDEAAASLENEGIATDGSYMDHAMRLRFEARVAAVQECRQRMADPKRRLESLRAMPSASRSVSDPVAAPASPVAAASTVDELELQNLKYPDWRHIAAVLIPSIDPTKETAFPASIETWTQAASSIFDLRTVEGKVRHERDLGVIQKSSKWRNYVDSRWRADRQLTSLERRALFYAIEHWDRSRAQVRFESRPLAVAWRDLLIDIGFEKAELEITVVATWFRKRSSHELHQMLPETDNLPGTARRRGKRGRIRIAFKGYGETARQVRSAGHFVMLLLAIREGYGDARRRRR